MPRLTLSLPAELGGRQSAGRARDAAEGADHRVDDGDAVVEAGSDAEATDPAIVRWFETWAEPRSP
jgi:hypothetical protein